MICYGNALITGMQHEICVGIYKLTRFHVCIHALSPTKECICMVCVDACARVCVLFVRNNVVYWKRTRTEDQ